LSEGKTIKPVLY